MAAPTEQELQSEIERLALIYVKFASYSRTRVKPHRLARFCRCGPDVARSTLHALRKRGWVTTRDRGGNYDVLTAEGLAYIEGFLEFWAQAEPAL